MRKNINIEVEGQELILKNKAGDYVIIPKKYRTKVQGMIKDNCHGCIDSLVETLPAMSDYAQDGTVFPSDDPITLIKPSGERVNTTTGSEFYRTHYNSKLIGKQNEDKSWNLIDEIYRGSDLPEVVISSKIIPNTLGDYSNQFSKQNPQDKFFANKQAAHNKEFYSAPLWAQQAVGGYNDKRKANDKKSDEEEYNQQRNDFIAEKLLKRTPFEGMNNRINWMNKFTPQELETIKKSKYSSELEEGALQKFENFILGMNTSGIKFKSKGTTAEEAEADQANPLNILQPLSIPTKAVQSAYKKNYSFSDAMKGKANNASIVEDIITDPLNLVGAGLVGKLSKADKVINATKTGIKVLNKEARLNKLTELELLSEKEIAQKRADRLLAQKDKWIGQDDKILEGQLKNAGKNHESNLTAQEFNIKYNSSNSPSNIGINKEGKTFIFKDAPLTELNKKRVAAHEVGHYYRNTLEEGLEWDKYFDFTGTSFKEKKYLRGKGLTGNGSVKGDELRERAAQLKDFIAVKNNIPLDKDFVITPSQFDDALKNYVKETGLNNNMETFIKAIKDKKGLLKEMNKKALGIITAALYLQSQQQNKTEQ